MNAIRHCRRQVRGTIRWGRGLLLLAALSVIGACSDADVVFRIDVQSFLTASGAQPDPSVGYALPGSPVAITVEDLPLLEPTSVDLVDALEDLTDVREVSLRYSVESRHRRGVGVAVVRLRLAADASALDAATAVVDSFTLTFDGPADTTIQRDVVLDARGVDLFRGPTVWFAARTDLRIPAAPADSLAGRLVLRAVDARVVADQDLF